MNKRVIDFRSPLIWLGIFLAFIYGPLAISGSMVQDDFGHLAHALTITNFSDYYHSLLTKSFANRPLAPLPIALATNLIGKNYSLYVSLNILIFLAAISIIVYLLRKCIGIYPATIFGLVAAIPAISMPTIVSPINLITGTTSLLYWAFAMWLITQFQISGGRWKYFFAYSAYICSLLTYEITFPLGIMLFLFPAIVGHERSSLTLRQYFMRFGSPILLALVIALIWQKIISPAYLIDQSRLHISPEKILSYLESWFDIFRLHLPALFYKSLKTSTAYDWLTCVLALIAMALSLRMRDKDEKSNNQRLIFLFASTFTLLAASLILVLSSSASEVGGYQSRALSPTWLGLSFFAAALGCISVNRIAKKILFILLATFICFSCNTFSIQRDNYIESWRIQTRIIEDLLSKIQSQGVPKGAVILGNLPNYTPNNFNNEIVFAVEWDFDAAIRLASNDFIGHGSVIDTRGGNFHDIRIINNRIILNNSDYLDSKKLWVYDFDQKKNQGRLIKVGDTFIMQSILDSLNTPRYIGRPGKEANFQKNESLDFSKKWYFDNEFFKSGWSINEGWGRWSDGQKAILILPVPADEPHSIEFNLQSFVSSGHPRQRVLVSVDNNASQEFVMKKFDSNFINVIIPEGTRNKTEAVIEFTLPDAISPRKINPNNSDQRNLGVGIKSAVFR